MNAMLNTVLRGSLDGKNAHLALFNAFDGIDVNAATSRIPDAPHTIWQLICHIDFWQDWFVELILTGKRKPVPHDVDGWVTDDAAPEDVEELDRLIQKIRVSVAIAAGMLDAPEKYRLTEVKEGYGNGYEVIQAMGNHLSYHVGQIMMLRRMIGNYPPPSGGDTW